MRTRMNVLTAALLIASAGYAQAQDAKPAATQSPADTTIAAPTLGTIDFGYRGSSVSGDPARYNRVRDLRDGPLVNAFRYEKETETTFFGAKAANVGYYDQSYSAGFERIGRLKASFDFDSVPLFQVQARTLFGNPGSATLRVADEVQQALQNGTLTQAQAMATATSPFDLKSRRDIAAFNMVYTASRDVDVSVSVHNTLRNGTNLQSFNFGNSPGNMTVLDMGVPVDDRTTDFRTKVEWANGAGVLALGYDGSWYTQNNSTFTWDNPLRATDSATAGPAFGRTALWPTSNANTMSVSGSLKLPARSKATAVISYGMWDQNQALLPNTTNTALAAAPLPRATAQTRANIASMLYSFTSRPADVLWLNARYRYYDYANKTPHFTNTVVPGDFSIGALETSEPSSSKRQTFDADASLMPYRYLGFSAGYSRENGDRTFRIYPRTTEDTWRVSVDSMGNQFVTARLKYESSDRTGHDFDEALLADIGEHVELRHYDIAPRDRRRTTALLTLTPVSYLDLNGTLFAGHDRYPETYFGLRDNQNDGYTVGFDLIPDSKITAGFNYGHETYSAFQWSRTANPLSSTDVTFLDPRRDWNLTTDERVLTYTATLDLIKAIRRTDIRLSYDLSDGYTNYDYDVVANATIPVPQQYKTQPRNRIVAAKVDGQYFVRANVAVGATYWYEEYSVQDFAFDPTLLAPQALPFAMYSGYVYEPYKAHTAFVRMTYLW